MSFKCTFRFVDGYGRRTTRSYTNTNVLIATVLTELATFAAALDVIVEGGLESVHISQDDTSEAFAAAATSNKDENMSCQVLAGDGYNYDFDLPMPAAAIINADGSLDTTHGSVITFFALFLTGATWRINVRAPTDIVTILGGQLDK